MKKILATLLAALFFIITFIIITVVIIFKENSENLPDYEQLKTYNPITTTRIYSSDGSLISEFSKEKRVFVEIKHIPQNLINAFLAAEDANFYKHSGIDFLDPFYSSLLFYDYTPNPNYIKKYQDSNYKLTFSRKEDNEQKCIEILKSGGNVAVVFANELPEFWQGYPVINGDLTDLRYFDPKNVVIGLTAKGKAKKDQSGFVVR